ncbi:MAG: hypothetical protein MK110_09435 [Fuerstiella sp.]|nr:hypothetical protein [Fuerstiella sp.]
MDRYGIKQPVGWALIVFSVFIMIGTLRNKYGGGPPLQQLVPYFGIPFVVVYLIVQSGLCCWFRTKIGFVWMAGALVVGLIGGSIGESAWSERTTPQVNPAVERVLQEQGVATSSYDWPSQYDWTRHKLICGVCLSGIALGFGFIREKL